MSVRKLHQENLIVSAPKVEHLAIRRRDWTSLRDRLSVCRPPIPWMSPAGWLAVGCGIGGLFTAYTLSPSQEILQTRVTAAALALLVVGIILLYVSRRLTTHAVDQVDALRTEMNVIEAECDVTPDDLATAEIYGQAVREIASRRLPPASERLPIDAPPE